MKNPAELKKSRLHIEAIARREQNRLEIERMRKNAEIAAELSQKADEYHRRMMLEIEMA